MWLSRITRVYDHIFTTNGTNLFILKHYDKGCFQSSENLLLGNLTLLKLKFPDLSFKVSNVIILF